MNLAGPNSARLRQLETIAELGRLILDGVSFQELLELVPTSVASALEVDCVRVLERLPDTRLRVIAAHGWERETIGEEITADNESLSRAGLTSTIEGDDGPFGVIAVHTHDRRAFNEDDANFLASVANKIAWELSNDREAALREVAELELRHTADRFRMLAENAQDIVFRFRLGPDPGYEYVSPATERITGFGPEHFYRDPDFALKHVRPEDRERVLAEREQEHREPALMRWFHPDGRLVWLEQRTTCVLGEDGRVVALEGIIRDMTEWVAEDEHRRQLEQQLQQAEKLNAIGQLAGGVAHDFNNLLLAIRGYGELAQRRLATGEDGASDDVAEILRAADRAADLTRQLLAFSRTQVMNTEVLDLRDVIVETVNLLRRLIGEDVELVTVLPDEPVLVKADSAQLGQVLTNLAINARDAMPDGGRLSIDVSAGATARAEYPEAVLVVTDSGAGMDAETAAQIFEPFFTTKRGDGGTGLGLATVHGIVRQSGGHIGVESELGRGTSFSVYLPLCDGRPAATPVAAPAPAGGAETILLVEDDRVVRSVVETMLTDRGYEVIAAEGGEEALTAARDREGPIDLVISDLLMRGMNGRQTVEGVRSQRPDTRVLYMSGYADDVVIRSGPAQPGTAFIQKPFTGNELALRVRELLDVEAA